MAKRQEYDFETVEYHPSSDQVKKLVFTFHGYGRNAWFMDKVAKDIKEKYPDTKVISLHAPEKLDLPESLNVAQMNMPEELMQDDGSLSPDMQRQWVSMSGGRLRIWWRIVSLTPKINAYIDKRRDEYGLEDKDLIYIGFSQGGAVALSSAFRRARAIGALIGHSTIYWGVLPIKSRPPIYYIYGEDDPSISSELYDKSQRRLGKLTSHFNVTKIPGQGHYISSTSRKAMIEYLSDYLPAPTNHR